MAGGRQLRLLLWKDYLTRKRNLLTLAGVIWASAIMFCLYIVRINVNNEDYPACQFPARALPSAGVMTFLQSFICSVNNECSPMDKYEEIPSYENSTLTQLKHKLSPIMNETVMDVASSVPDALKLLSTLADVADEPTFLDFTQNGLIVGDLFRNPMRVKRFLESHLELDEDVAQSVLDSGISFQGILKGNMKRCNVETVSKTLIMNSTEDMEQLVTRVCSLSTEELQKIFMDLIMEINFSKYIKMFGGMYYKLSDDNRLTQLGDMITSVIRMTSLRNFLPPEITSIFYGEQPDFSYIQLSLLPRLMELFKPTFSDTQSYKSLNDFSDTIVNVLQYMDKIFSKTIDDTKGTQKDEVEGLKKVNKLLDNAVNVLEEVADDNHTVDKFEMLARVTNFIHKLLPNNYKHDVLFYSTLLAKLMEAARNVIAINMNIEKIAYETSVRNPTGVKILVSLPPYVVGKAFEALADADRVQILTSKINQPGQMFCDANKIANFFVVSKEEADSLKKQFCTDAWKNYISDLIKSFGVFDVRYSINNMAALVIQETLGQDTSDLLYSIDKDFKILKNFSYSLIQMEEENRTNIDWSRLFSVSNDSEFMQVVRQKGHLGKIILITVHGAMAKEVVQQNPILDYKFSPTLLRMTTLLVAMNEQLEAAPGDVANSLKKKYGDIVRTMLKTALNEHKTYKSLSTYSEDIFCKGVENAEQCIEFPSEIDREALVSSLCDASKAIEEGLKNTSIIAKAIKTISNSSYTGQVNWSKLINSFKLMYLKINNDYPYVLDFANYGMDAKTKAEVDSMCADAKVLWFGVRNLARSLHLSVKLGLRFLDLIDHGTFNISDKVWLNIKYVMSIATGPLNVLHDTIAAVTALVMNQPQPAGLPPITASSLDLIIPNISQLIIDSVNIIASDNTDIDPIISIMNAEPGWPCSTMSVSDLILMAPSSKEAVKSMERLLCLDQDLQEEWVEYLDKEKARIPSRHDYNTTRYTPLVFLRLSSTFDALVNDTGAVRDAFSYVLNDGALTAAWEYAVKVLNTSENKVIMRKFLSKLDTVLNSVNTTTTTAVPLNKLWEEFTACANATYIDIACRKAGRTAWKYSLQTISLMLDSAAEDLLTYFREIRDPDSNLLQILGFTKNTGLYILYDRVADLANVLLNSYWDYGFMTQVRRATGSQFWDCHALISALVPPPGSPITKETIKKIQPFLCPSLLYWLSLPRGDNILFDLVAKPQYYFYTHHIENTTSHYEKAFTKATELSEIITDLAKTNTTFINKEDFKIDVLRKKLENFVDSIMYYRVKETDPNYIAFYEINTKQYISSIYLTQVVAMVNKLASNIDNIDFEAKKDADIKKIKEDVTAIKNMYKRRTIEMISMLYDILTDVLWNRNLGNNYSLLEAMESMCDNVKNNVTSKTILGDETRTKLVLCSKKYEVIFAALQNVIDDNLENASRSLRNLVNSENSGIENITDIFEFLNERKQLVSSLKTSIKYSYDLGLPIYLKSLQSNLQGYGIIITFLSGGNWWEELKRQYDGPQATKFLGYLEQSFEVVDNVFDNIDRIHLVRLLHDVNVNESDAICQPSIKLSDYIPDSTGIVSDLQHQICDIDVVQLFKEIPPLRFAAQGYESSLKLPNDINYTSLYYDIAATEFSLDQIKDGPKTPQLPPWATDEKISSLRSKAVQLLSKETLTKMSFGMLSNFIDAGTLFLNNSQCTLCSQFTTWFKQLNLQLIKKEEYDNLLCHMPAMSLEDIYSTLKNDFHWDMAVRELISTRNYTKYELNKSMNEFLELVKQHLLQDLTADTIKVAECLTSNVTNNGFGNVTLFLSIATQTARLLRAELPHLQEVAGITDLQYLKQLSNEVAHNLDIFKPIKDYMLKNNNLREELMKEIDDEVIVADIEKSEVNLRIINMDDSPIDQNMRLKRAEWKDVCEDHNCTTIAAIIIKNLNKTVIEKELPKLQNDEFWRFTFVSDIILHIEELVAHATRLVGVASHVDVAGVMEGRLEAMIDMMMTILMDETMDSVLYSMYGLIEQLHPLLRGTELEFDLRALSVGLKTIHQFKTYLVEDVDLKVDMAIVFPNLDAVEAGLNALGINNTNFWSLAAPRLNAGYVQLKPIFNKQQPYHISAFVCQPEYMAQVFFPSDLDVVSAEEVFAAMVEQFCGLEDQRAKQLLPVLIGNLNFTFIMEKISDKLLTKLYATSNLTQEEGSLVLSRFSQMAALLPVVQENMADLSDTLANEPIFQSLKDFSTVGNLLTSSDFMSNAGKMLCGKPFNSNVPRLLRNIISNKDNSAGPSQAQLDVLPTDFCRSLYKEIVSVDGGKIVWSFVKPLIMGKILYTPVDPTVTRIIEKANATFASMIKMTGLVHSFAKSFPALDKLSSHRDGVSALMNLVTSPNFEELRSMIIGDVQLPDMDMDGLFDQIGDMKGLGNILSKASDLLRCINLNRFRAATDEYQLTHQAAELSLVNEFSAGIVFKNTELQNDGQVNVDYVIRMDIENVPTTKWKKSYLWTPGPEANFIENMRYFRGFVQIQDIVDKAIVQLSHTRSKRETSEELDWAVYTQQIPYPCYRKDFYQTSLYESQALIVAFFFSLLFTVASAVRFIVADKETGNTMLMSVMGVNLSYHTLSWFIVSFAEMVVTVGCMTLVLHYGLVVPRTDPTLVFALLFVFGISVLSFCYMMSKLFSSASFAAVCTALAYLTTFMPFVMILSLEAVMVSSLKLLVCLSMSSSLCYAFLYITRYEATGSGATWADLWSSPIGSEDMSIGLAAIMVLVDAAIYFIIGWLIDRYFGIKTQSSNVTHCTTTDDKAGVSIINVTKIYGEGTRRAKLALDNVSMELHKGQITTLLGHNGAGKTTLINILTGMVRPSRGHVSVRGGGADGAGGAEGRARLGVCPQRDVLHACLTPREHVRLYAMLNHALQDHQVDEEVDRMLQVLSLGPWSEEPVMRLSGGTRRRLCVALAFIAKPHLVSLDEPTSGVDPAARRDIWSMIVKLKQDRTILLTTHHLDEAELLSDQIVIMHKGQIHTTGSPIEIKRALGNGYKLTVVYPEKRQDWDETLEEKTKQLLAVVRDTIRNANVVDVNGMEVEIALPFYDANGINNNFHQLCLVLEASQAVLGFKNFSLDCGSLEQVFYDICQQADSPEQIGLQYVEESPSSTSKSSSGSSIRTDEPLVPAEGPLRASRWEQFKALMHSRYIHHLRNRWLLFMLLALPTIFVTTAMAFSMLRPPADNEVSLVLDEQLYAGSTEFLVPHPSVYPGSKHVDPMFAQRVMDAAENGKQVRNWTEMDSPSCVCEITRQVCDIQTNGSNLPEMMSLPDVNTLNSWLLDSQEVYIERRYGGVTSAIKNNLTNIITWYNNKGHHALPVYLNMANNALLRTVARDPRANITVSTHPLKISKEPISKDTVYQHIADAGISSLVLIGYSLISAGAAIYLVHARRTQQKRLQLLCGVSPALYWGTALVWDMLIICINMVVTALVMLAFGFPVFVARNNLPAICLLFILYGYGCANLIHVAEKMFSEPSMANMMLFCGNTLCGLAGITILLILDIISESDRTDDARWYLHKLFMLSPQFVLGDGMLEIAKNTIQAQVLQHFGMDTYRDPFTTDLIVYHYAYLVVVGTALLLLNLAIECGFFEGMLLRFHRDSEPELPSELEPVEVAEERKRVRASRAHPLMPIRINTIGNINRGFVQSACDKKSVSAWYSGGDVAQLSAVRVRYRAARGARDALAGLTLGLRAGQCTALLGQNGAGKSTTFGLLTGEVLASSGDLYLNDKKVDSRKLCQGLISYCPQSDAIDHLLTVTETLEFYCRLRGIKNQEEVIRRTIALFELGKYAGVRAGTLSGGNKRKLCTAVAFMARTPLVLLDEPTSGMDPASRACVSRAVRACSLGSGGARAVLLSTHALDDARRLAATVALLRAGRLVALAPLDDCLTRFGGGYVVQCVAAAPRAVWRRLRARAPHASLRVLHARALHFLLPTTATVDKKEVTTRLSDIFRLMSEMQASCDIEDYTVNQSSLEQMFLSFTDKAEVEVDPVDIEPLPSPEMVRSDPEELDSITSL
ncbi:uncharacterized protein LOC115442462 [Manduca sexta]|uniref:uncharacterized protein LOC115442462 n=1 Tax=Manduca sexta TaxID=7130 RepID=UPI00188EC747|nr:uncharacterized protein LOC115442462 [Manduca sexta]